MYYLDNILATRVVGQRRNDIPVDVKWNRGLLSPLNGIVPLGVLIHMMEISVRNGGHNKEKSTVGDYLHSLNSNGHQITIAVPKFLF